jgi:hypothetical protein
MRRLAATFAGLALVCIPSAIAMSSADTAAKSAQPSLTPVYYQSIQSAPRQHRGRHCHRPNGAQQPQSGGGAPDV